LPHACLEAASKSMIEAHGVGIPPAHAHAPAWSPEGIVEAHAPAHAHAHAHAPTAAHAPAIPAETRTPEWIIEAAHAPAHAHAHAHAPTHAHVHAHAHAPKGVIKAHAAHRHHAHAHAHAWSHVVVVDNASTGHSLVSIGNAVVIWVKIIEVTAILRLRGCRINRGVF
jgi:hypothetical protein